MQFFFLNDFISLIKRINIWKTSENLPKGNNSKLFISFLLKKTFVIVFVSLAKTTLKDFQAPAWIYSGYRHQNLIIMDVYHFLVCFIFLKRSLLPLISVPLEFGHVSFSLGYGKSVKLLAMRAYIIKWVIIKDGYHLHK